MSRRKRLHVTPLHEQLLSTVLSNSILHASNISSHLIPTFPEKNYGYVDLSDTEADKLKKKLNGSVLKGLKMRVEEARPKKVMPGSRKDWSNMEISEAKVLRSKRKRVKEEGVLPGHELKDRKIKRGWTESTSGNTKKSKPKPTSITGEAECLFKTTIPSKATSSGNTPAKDSRVKKRKRGASNRHIIVHEFANATKHAKFLRDESDAKTRSATSSEVAVPSVRVTSPTAQDARATLLDETFPSSENETASDEPSPEPAPRPGPRPSKKTSKGNSTSKEVHPLEAIFKQPKIAASHTPKKPALEVTTNFNLSDPDVDENGYKALLPIPQTPFTQQDIRQRRQQSAAPTPDTAAPGKTFIDMWAGTSDNEEDKDEDSIGEEHTPRSTKAGAQESTKEKPESEFSKWFWDHRGETNRAWKRRRREAAKEKRHKDNKERRG
ncbi:hypothetical protein MMC28_009750 [Mycoblastus sanguinarius]|nr:hypothetical protein [Mycoblastus sanguinarius]